MKFNSAVVVLDNKTMHVLLIVTTLIWASNVNASEVGYFGEYCASTKLEKKAGFGAQTIGNPFGHASLILRGACLDTTQSIPLLKLCEPNAKEKEVGVSTDGDFGNVSWIAVPGRSFYFYGDLDRRLRLTEQLWVKTLDQAKQHDLLKGVTPAKKVYQDTTRPHSMSIDDFLWEDTMATDYAVSLGRNTYCAGVPLTLTQLKKMIFYLNQLNKKANKAGHQFNKYYANCAHTAYNSFSVAQVVRQWNGVAFPFTHLYLFEKQARKIKGFKKTFMPIMRVNDVYEVE